MANDRMNPEKILLNLNSYIFFSACAFFGAICPAMAEQPTAEVLAERLADIAQPRSRNIVDFQPYRTSRDVTGEDGSTITLTALQPEFNTWFVLQSGSGRYTESYHLELSDPEKTGLSLENDGGPVLVFTTENGISYCTPWEGRKNELSKARSSGLPYAPICENLAFLRNEVRGNRSSREAVAEFLRDNIVFGESLVELIKGSFYEDAYMSSGEIVDGGTPGEIVAAMGKARLTEHPVMSTYFGFDLDGAERGVEAGAWYAVKDATGVFASAMQPGMIAPDVLAVPGTHGFDGVENRADVYLIAFDLSRFEVGYELGTDHPRLDWSDRAQVNRMGMAGPDGFGSAAPLARTGMLSPALTERVAATFSAGFKRSHSAWRASEMSTTRGGHHYGFVQQGTVFSRLHPGLATLFVLDDGTIQMRSWTDADDALLPRVKFARQNGVPLVIDGLPGPQVTSWLGGNWSGSAEADLRTLRGGACMKTVGTRKFLIYAYFSSATPSAMARTFMAYDCDYAMLLDMNSQEHTYLAIYSHEDGRALPRHLVRGMSAIDGQTRDGWPIPRFVSFADNRDFFYLLRK